MSDRPAEDLLTSVLGAYQLRAGIYATPRLCDAWQMGTSGDRRASFHLIGEGHCWLHTRRSETPRMLRAGDLLILPHDDWHLLSGKPALQGEEQRMLTQGEGPYASLLCGYFEFLTGYVNPVIAALPPVLRVPADEGGQTLSALARLLLAEINTSMPGTLALLNKLSEAVFVLAVRHHIATSPQRQGLIAGLAEPRIRKVLDALHEEPGSNWSVDHMAQLAAMSRSAFAQRFSELMGDSPVDYLTRWRMTRAELMLRDSHVSVSAAAADLGYTDEAAFRKAFKRVHGYGPGLLRRLFRGRASP